MVNEDGKIVQAYFCHRVTRPNFSDIEMSSGFDHFLVPYSDRGLLQMLPQNGRDCPHVDHSGLTQQEEEFTAKAQ